MALTPEQIGLAKLREPFSENQIGMLPKPIRKTTPSDPRFMCIEGHPEARQASVDGRFCGGKHVASIHLDYVGHAALTDRLLDADPEWTWEPLALNDHGLPQLDQLGGLWIKLTVRGVTRLGYGDSQGKTGANAIKEAIGDALRNAGMRFGAALDLWHKGDLHDAEEARGSLTPDEAPKAPTAKRATKAATAPVAPQPAAIPTGEGTPAVLEPDPMARATPNGLPADWDMDLDKCADRADLNDYHARATAEGWLNGEVVNAMKEKARSLGIAPKGAK